MNRILPFLVTSLVLPACGDDDGGSDDSAGTSDATGGATDETGGGDTAGDTGGETGTTDDTDGSAEPPLELTPDLCDDPDNMALLLDSLQGDGNPSYGELNPEQIQRMVQAPTEGPFYMVNLIRYRDMAVYPDGRDTDMTGREANALYAPTEFIEAIGARIAFNGEVSNTILGEDGKWHDVAIVEYPCPIALFAMSAHPDFQARSIHKDAGVETSIVMVTHLQPIDETEPADSPHPPTAEDPAFELVQVHRYRDQAEYEAGADEDPRTGNEAMDLYASSILEAERRNGIYPKARLAVQGVFIGDGRPWDQVWIDYVPSQAARDAVLSDPDVVAAQHHHDAALEDAYGVAVNALISSFPGGEGGGDDTPTPPPVTPDGMGTPCLSDADCPGDGVDTCISDGSSTGFCTREACGAGECESPYACCRDCSDLVASMLPFEGSACFPEDSVAQLTAAPASCTCD